MANDRKNNEGGDFGGGDHDDDDDVITTHGSSSSGSQGGGVSVGETIKKLVTAGVSAAFMTEESVRSFVSELKLPKETLNLLLQGANKSKEELMNRVSREVIGMISKIDLVKEASRFVEEHKFKISAEVEVVRKKPQDSSGSATEK
jgi:hypothetical protein